MESLFRFVQVRPPSIKDPSEGQAEVTTDNGVAIAADALLAAKTSKEEGDAQVALRAAVHEIPDAHALTTDAPVALAKSLIAVGNAWTKAAKELTAAQAAADIMAAVGKAAAELAADEAFQLLRKEVSARIIAARMGSRADARRLPRLVVLMRAISVVGVIPAELKAATQETDDKIRAILRNPVRLPSKIFPLPLRRAQRQQRLVSEQIGALKEKLDKAIATRSEQAARLNSALNVAQLTRRAETTRQRFYGALLAGDLQQAGKLSEEGRDVLKRLEQVSPVKGDRVLARQADRAYNELLRAAMQGLKHGAPAGNETRERVRRSFFRSAARRVIRVEQAAPSFLQRPEALSTQTRQLIAHAGLDPAKDSFPAMAQAMRGFMFGGRIPVAPLSGRTPGWQIQPGAFGNGGGAEDGDDTEDAPEGLPGVPTTVGAVAPSGIGDLLVVRQHIKRYDSGEIAHIENVVPGETRERLHELTLDSTTRIMDETETEKTEDRDLSSTDRFEMSRETGKTVATDMAMHVGVAASYKYGSVLTVNADASLDTNRTTEKSEKEAKTYASDVTARTASRITERALSRREHTLRRIVFEKNLHRMSGTGFQKPGVYRYQWQNKIYEAQIFNYGKRLLFDVVVPEPAALFIRAARGAVNEPELQEPIPLTETVLDVNEENYTDLAARYGSAIPEAPPLPEEAVTWAHNIAAADDPRNDNGSTDLAIPDGYRLHSVHFNLTDYTTEDEDDSSLSVVVGSYMRTFDWDSPWSFVVSAAGEMGPISASYSGFRLNSGGFNVRLVCVLTENAREQWRNKAYATIRDSYQQAVEQYNQALAERAAAAVPVVMGRNPDANRVTERLELKRLCIETITAQHFTHFGAVVERGTPKLPEIDFEEAKAEGSYIRFIEEAFEWESISYQFYPYFWSRRSTWIDRVLFADKDPLFNEFLRAGSARVTVPVRPGYEELVAQFLETGQPWGTSGMPDVESDEYQSVADLVREVTDAHGKDETPYGNSWEISIPTDLVAIREEVGSPEWEYREKRWALKAAAAAEWPALAAAAPEALTVETPVALLEDNRAARAPAAADNP